jgi:hypothetical protein
MANTVISLLSSGESGNTPLASALSNGELALNFADGIIYYKTATGSLGQFRLVEPSGLDSEIQFNDSGTFGSNASLTFDKTTGVFSSPNVTANSIATKSYIQFPDGSLQFTANAGSGGGSITVTFDTQPPATGNTVGDQWIDSNSGSLFKFIDDGDSLQWVEFGTTPGVAPGGSGNVDLSSVAQSIVPAADVTYDLGTESKRWRDLFLSGNTINLGGATISTDAESGAIALIPQPTEANPNPSGVVVSPAGGFTTVSTEGGVVSGNAIADAAAAPTATPVPINIITTPPVDGQALIWDSEKLEFVPGDMSGGTGGITTGKAIAMSIVFGG